MEFSVNELIFLGANGTHTQYLDTFIYLCSRPLPWIPFYICCATCLWMKFGFRKTLLYLVLIGISVGLSDFICAKVLRPYFHIMRPSNPENSFSRIVTIVNDKRGGAYGFPSCHAANCFALAVGLSILSKNWFRYCLIAWAIFICWTRLYLGVHYPTDLLGGAIIGTLMGMIVFLYPLADRAGWFRKSNGFNHRITSEAIPFAGMLITLGILALISIP